MKKILLTSVLLGTIAGSISLAFALNAGTSGRIVDDFKTRHEKILFETLPFSETGANDILEYEYRMNGLSALKTRMAEVEDYYKEKKGETTRERLSLENAIAKLDESIQLTEKAIRETKVQILSREQKIKTLNYASVELKKKISEHRKILLSYVANLYSEGNLIFDDEGEVDIMKALILTSEDTDYYLTDLTYKSLVSQLGQKFIDEYRELVRNYYVNTVRAKEEQANLQELENNLDRQNMAYEAQKKEREEILEITKGQESMYIQYIAKQQEAQHKIAESWKKASEDYQKSFERFLEKYNCTTESKTEECVRLRQFFQNETQLARSEYKQGTDNILIWPVPSRRITTYFRDPSYYRLIGSHHDAIDIGSTPQGTDVKAAADGYVYYIMQPTSKSYSYVAIKHKDGIVTVYGHLSEVKVKPYQFVYQGEVIAKSGGAPGTPGAGPVTTGPHLHFEVWKNREAVDPLRYISTADIDYKQLPAVYQTKFLKDIVEKSGTGANLSDYKLRFSLRGNTEEERQKYLLNTYAIKPFKNWEMWTDTAIAANIDPSFLMCIGLSETTLGNHLKTPYNIGNVGNTDDGSTVSFSSPQEGLTWMAKTFNNRYLGKYTKISELSRWGNKSGPIYASSGSNWHDNSIRCLSALKGRFVENNFNFRIKK